MTFSADALKEKFREVMEGKRKFSFSSPNPLAGFIVEHRVAFTLLDLRKIFHFGACVAIRMHLGQHFGDLENVVLHLEHKVLGARHQNDVNLDEFPVVLELARVKLDERIVWTTKRLNVIECSLSIIKCHSTHPKLSSSVPRVVAN